jgi:sec-independent protein translocase protein TatA
MLGLDNPVHLIFLLILLLLLFGATRLPEAGRSLGVGIRGFKDSLKGESGQHAELGSGVQSATADERIQAASSAGEPR